MLCYFRLATITNNFIICFYFPAQKTQMSKIPTQILAILEVMAAVQQSFWNLHWDALSSDHPPLFCLQPPTFTTSTQDKFTFLPNLHTDFLCNINLAVRTMFFQSSLFQNSSVTFSIMSWIHRTRLWSEGERKRRDSNLPGQRCSADCTAQTLLYLNAFSANLIRRDCYR